MKVRIDNNVDVSDEQRIQIANVIDQKVTRRKATRDELKDFIWGFGASWEDRLNERYDELAVPGDPDLEAAIAELI